MPYSQLPAVDRWLLSSHARLMAEVKDAYETYQVRRPLLLLLLLCSLPTPLLNPPTPT